MFKTTINEDEKRRSREYFESIRNKDYTEEELHSNYETVINNEDKIMDKISRNSLLKWKNQAKLFFSMIKDYFSRDYREIPFKSIIGIVMTLLYVFSPVDIIPDFIPVVGLMDDAVVLSACVACFGSELNSYKKWKEEQKNNKK